MKIPRTIWQTKKRSRAGVIGSVTKEIKTAQPAINSKDIFACKVSLGKLKDYISRIDSASVEIQFLMKADDKQTDVDTMTQNMEIFADTVVRLQTVVEDSKEAALLASQASSSAVPGSPFGHNTSSVSDHVSSRIRLPKLDPIKYDGDVLKFQEFWDNFDSCVHSQSLSDIEKFRYLKDQVTGDAAVFLSQYRLQSALYPEAVKAFKERFGDDQVAIFCHLEALLNMTPAKQDVADLQRVFDESEAHIRSLIALGLEEETFGVVFVPMLLSKLTNNVRLEVIRQKGRGKWKLSELRNFLKDELYARQMCRRVLTTQRSDDRQSSSPNNGSKGNQGGHWKSHQGTASALVASHTPSKQDGPRSSPRCVFCGGQHYSDKCTKVSGVRQRLEKVRGSRCFSCLGEGHQSKECRFKKECYYCKKKNHHSSLCYQKEKSGKSGATMNLDTASDDEAYMTMMSRRTTAPMPSCRMVREESCSPPRPAWMV